MLKRKYFILPEAIRWKVLITVLAIIYFLLPNSNHLGDSYGYGASVKYGVDLFSPHHLLYTWINYLLYHTFSAFFTLDALRFMQAINAFVSLLNLILLRYILRYSGNESVKADWLSFAVGVCFGVLRFSVEAEVYIMPIFFSLLSSLYYLKYLKIPKNFYALLSGFMAAIACLFHQIHLFWGIGLFVGWLFTRHYKAVFSYLALTPLVLVAYIAVLSVYYNADITLSNVYHYLASYYYSDNADVMLGFKDLLITAITFFRTFYQVHGLVVEVFNLMPVAAILSSFVALSFLIAGLVVSFKRKWFVLSSFKGKYFSLTHVLIFIMQFAFAFFSHGNSEFMIMLPFALVIALSGNITTDMYAVKLFTYSMLTWNIVFGILPNHIYDYKNERSVMKMLHENPDKILIVKERCPPVNLYFYMYGIQELKNIVELGDVQKIKKLQKDGFTFWTGMLSEKTLYDRTSFTNSSKNIDFQFIRHIQRVEYVFGSYYVDEVRP